MNTEQNILRCLSKLAYVYVTALLIFRRQCQNLVSIFISTHSQVTLEMFLISQLLKLSLLTGPRG